MNNTLLNNLQLYRGRRFSDLVDENMISNALLTKPHEVSGLLSLVFGTKDDGVSTAIDLITGGLGKTMIIENREYEWSVMIDQEHAMLNELYDRLSPDAKRVIVAALQAAAQDPKAPDDR